MPQTPLQEIFLEQTIIVSVLKRQDVEQFKLYIN